MSNEESDLSITITAQPTDDGRVAIRIDAVVRPEIARLWSDAASYSAAQQTHPGVKEAFVSAAATLAAGAAQALPKEKTVQQSPAAKQPRVQRPSPRCTYNDNMKGYAEAIACPLNLTSTRSDEDVDAHRDMDGFDEDKELARLRRAVREAQRVPPADNPALYQFIAEAFDNIDEHLRRLGALPRGWTGAVDGIQPPPAEFEGSSE